MATFDDLLADQRFTALDQDKQNVVIGRWLSRDSRFTALDPQKQAVATARAYRMASMAATGEQGPVPTWGAQPNEAPPPPTSYTGEAAFGIPRMEGTPETLGGALRYGLVNQGLGGLQEGVGGLAGMVSPSIRNVNMQQAQIRSAEDIAADKASGAQWTTGKRIVAGAGALIPTVASAFVGGELASAAPILSKAPALARFLGSGAAFGGQAAGQTYSGLVASGIDPKAALMPSLANGAVNFALGGGVMGVLGKASKGTGIVRSVVHTTAITTAMAAAGEGATVWASLSHNAAHPEAPVPVPTLSEAAQNVLIGQVYSLPGIFGLVVGLHGVGAFKGAMAARADGIVRDNEVRLGQAAQHFQENPVAMNDVLNSKSASRSDFPKILNPPGFDTGKQADRVMLKNAALQARAQQEAATWAQREAEAHVPMAEGQPTPPRPEPPPVGAEGYPRPPSYAEIKRDELTQGIQRDAQHIIDTEANRAAYAAEPKGMEPSPPFDPIQTKADQAELLQRRAALRKQYPTVDAETINRVALEDMTQAKLDAMANGGEGVPPSEREVAQVKAQMARLESEMQAAPDMGLLTRKGEPPPPPPEAPPPAPVVAPPPEPKPAPKGLKAKVAPVAEPAKEPSENRQPKEPQKSPQQSPQKSEVSATKPQGEAKVSATPKAADVIDAALKDGKIDAETATVAKSILRQFPDVDADTTMRILDETHRATVESAVAHGIDPKVAARVLAHTDSRLTLGGAKHLMEFYKGADARTFVHEWYHRFWHTIELAAESDPAAAKAWGRAAQWANESKSRGTKTIREFLADEGANYFFDKRESNAFFKAHGYDKASAFGSSFGKVKDTILNFVRKLVGMKGENMPAEVKAMLEEAVAPKGLKQKVAPLKTKGGKLVSEEVRPESAADRNAREKTERAEGRIRGLGGEPVPETGHLGRRLRAARSGIRALAAKMGIKEEEVRTRTEAVAGTRNLTDIQDPEMLKSVRADIENKSAGRNPKQTAAMPASGHTIQKIDTLTQHLVATNRLSTATRARLADELGITGHPSQEQAAKLLRAILHAESGETLARSAEAGFEKAPDAKVAADAMLARAEKDAPKGAVKIGVIGNLTDQRYELGKIAAQLKEPDVARIGQALLDTGHEVEHFGVEAIRTIRNAVPMRDWMAMVKAEPKGGRIRQILESRNPSSGVTVPENITKSERIVADGFAKLWAEHELKVRKQKFLGMYDLHGANMIHHLRDATTLLADAPTRDITEAVHIYETQGEAGLDTYLATKTWGVIERGYVPRNMQGMLNQAPPAVMNLGKSHIMVRDTPEAKLGDSIFEALPGYLHQVNMRDATRGLTNSLMQHLDRAWEDGRIDPSAQESLESMIWSLKGIRIRPGAVDRAFNALGAQASAVIFVQPKLGIRNAVQLPAMGREIISLADPRTWTKPLTANERAYLATYGGASDLLDAMYLTQDLPVPFFGRATLWARKIGAVVQGGPEYANRYGAFLARLRQSERALEKYDAAIKAGTPEAQARASFEGAARVPDMSDMQRVLFWEKFGQDRADALHFLAREYSNKVNAQYNKREGSIYQMAPNMGTLRLLTFPRNYIQQVVGETKKAFAPGRSAGERYNAAANLASYTVQAVIVGAIADKIFGFGSNPYNPLSMAGWSPGGLTVGVATDAAKAVGHILNAVNDKNARAQLPTELSRLSDTLIPFYKIAINNLDAAMGTERIDKDALREIRGMIDAEYNKRDRVKVQRTLWERMRKAIIGGKQGTPITATTTKGLRQRKLRPLRPVKQRRAN